MKDSFEQAGSLRLSRCTAAGSASIIPFFILSPRRLRHRAAPSACFAPRPKHYADVVRPPPAQLRRISVDVYYICPGGRLPASSNSEKDVAILV